MRGDARRRSASLRAGMHVAGAPSARACELTYMYKRAATCNYKNFQRSYPVHSCIEQPFQLGSLLSKLHIHTIHSRHLYMSCRLA